LVDAAIFGAGVAGLVTAITLRSAGHESRIYERACQSQDAGMGFILVPECIQYLQSLEVKPCGVPLDRYRFRNEAGRILREQAMPAGCRAIRRRDLIGALVRSLPVNEAITFDSELDSLQFDDAGTVSAARLNSGEHNLSVQASLYVAADGIGSRGRQALFPGWPTPQAQVQELVGLVRSSETISWAANDFNKFHASGGGIAVGILPVDAEHVVWFLQFDVHRFPSPGEEAQARQNFVRRLVGDWADPIPSLLAGTDFSRVHLWLPVNTDLVPHFNQGNLVLVGDAAHPLLPFTSQGVSSAVADAIALANALKAESDVARALANYSVERHQQCSQYVAKGRAFLQRFLEPLGNLNELPIA
jgi:2-polyprenyl-6-methoxyphenol hydroxylase-like FAD-dependent oxidoreductase